MSTPTIQEGTLIEYRLKVHGIPMRWTTRIEEWKPGVRFVDNQLRGPYSLWHHTHTFEAKDGGTLMRDRVRFRLPLGKLGDFFGSWLVKRDVSAIFEFRKTTIDRLFPKTSP
jgi:ligand-binding SRPBCC domain-containing protein